MKTKQLLVMFVSLFIVTSNAVQADIKPAQRIVALSPHSVELLFALGAGDRSVATTSFADYPEAAKSILQIGGYNGIQIETVLKLKPDLIVAWEGGNPGGDIDRLEQLGLRVYRSETKSLVDIKRELIELGRLTGLENKAQSLAQQFQQDWDLIRQQNMQKDEVSFFYQLWAEPLRTMAAGSWINEILSACGGRNIFSDAGLEYPQVSMEHILKSMPESIIVPSHHGTVAGTAEQWQDWSEIPPVNNDHIFYIDGDILHRFSLRVIQGMEQVCQAFEQVRAKSAKKTSDTMIN